MLAALPTLSHAFPTRNSVLWGVGAGLFEGAYFVSLGRALASAPLGFAYTITRGGSLVIAWPVSVAWLGERWRWSSVLATLLVLAGVALTAPEKPQAQRGGGVAWALIGAVCVAGYHLSYKFALAAGANPYALFALALALAVPCNVAALGRNAMEQVTAIVRTSARVVVLAGVLCASSFLLFLQALAMEGAGAVLTLRNTSVVFALLLGILLGEPLRRRSLMGGFLVVLGAAILARK